MECRREGTDRDGARRALEEAAGRTGPWVLVDLGKGGGRAAPTRHDVATGPQAGTGDACDERCEEDECSVGSSVVELLLGCHSALVGVGDARDADGREHQFVAMGPVTLEVVVC